MKAIILAAGMGTRLGKYTEHLPKCMLSFEGMPLIDRQVQTLRRAGINEISIVRGYEPAKIRLQGVKYFFNPEYAETNMSATLMAAHDEFVSDVEGCLVCYADIIYERRLIELLISANADVGVLVDDSWKDYWRARSDDWENDVESLQYDSSDRIFEIGTPRCSLDLAQSRYIGLIKFSHRGASEFVRAFEENRGKYWNADEPWRQSKSFRKAYMTCMLQELIDRGVEVKAVHTKRGWMEFDTTTDYEKALMWQREGKLSNFIDLKQTC